MTQTEQGTEQGAEEAMATELFDVLRAATGDDHE